MSIREEKRQSASPRPRPFPAVFPASFRQWIDAPNHELVTGTVAFFLVAAFAVLMWSPDYLLLHYAIFDFFVAWHAGAAWDAGQVPSIDFPSALGVFYHVVQGLGHSAAGGSADAVSKANIIALVLTLPVMLAVLIPRFPFMIAGVLTLFLGTWMISPRQEDLGFSGITFFADYNRHCFIWMSLALLAAAIPWRDRDHPNRQIILDGLVIGAVFTAIVYTKITYAVYASFAVMLLLYLRTGRDVRESAYRLLWAAPPFLLAAFVLEVTHWGYHFRYLSDLAYTISIQGTNPIVHRLFEFPYHSWTFLRIELFLFLVFSYFLYKAFTQKDLLSVVVPLIVVPAVMFVTNIQSHATYFPIFSMAAIVAIGLLLNTKTLDRQSGSQLFSKANAVKLGLLPVLFNIVLEGGTIANYYAKTVTMEVSGRYTGFPDLGFYLWADNWAAEEMIPAYQGMNALIDNAGASRDGVVCLGVSNACPIFTGGRIPTGQLPWWDPGRSFGKHNPPAPEKAFKDTNTILVSKINSPYCSYNIFEIYQDYIKTNFEQAKETEHWYLWRRKAIDEIQASEPKGKQMQIRLTPIEGCII